jgi:hypothetical protein
VDGGFVSFTDQFKYLGGMIHSSLTSDVDVNKRISSATAAFGALRSCFFNRKDIKPQDKGKVYVSLCISVLLYGSESWCLTEKLFQKLRVFHHGCARAMSRVTLKHTRKYRVSSKTLLKNLGLYSLDQYYNSRLLRWAGHIARMPMTRLPRMLLTGWVNNKRPVGGVNMTFGRTLNKALKSRGIPTNFSQWHKIAQDRHKWRAEAGLNKPSTH